MGSRTDELFARWCARRDVEAVGELFDLTAPKLLRAAVHLVGDACEAEDLVQQTFLALLEQGRALDGSRPAMPWLIGVLTHKAADARRRAARPLDPERLQRAEEEAPDAPLERRELSAELAAAVDGLEEPYRAVVVLRLRHGLAPAEIAHALGRSPGTVRVQLHRGHELLRRALPASLVGGLALLLGAPRGLAAVRDVVLDEAAATAAATAVTSALGAWIVSQKVLLVAACAVVLTVLGLRYLAQPSLEAPVRPAEPVVAPPRAQEAPRDAALAVARSRPERAELVADAAARAGAETGTGRVLDAADGAPLAGARVRLFAPTRATLPAALRAHPALYEQEANGGARGRTGGDWPRVEGLDDASRFGAEALTVFDLPAPDAAPLAETTTDAQGGFTLPAFEDGALLEVVLAGYGARYRGAPAAGEEVTLALWRTRVMRGRVYIATTLEPPAEPVRLAFSACRVPDVQVWPEDGKVVHTAEDIEGLGTWTTTTAADGSFAVEVAADTVSVDVLDAGWGFSMSMSYPVGEEVALYLERQPYLHVVDDADGAPIERVRLLGRELANGYVLWGGAFEAPGGRLAVPGEAVFLRYNSDKTMRLTVWAEGYEGTSLQVVDLVHQGELEVRLRRGATPRLAGRVLRDGRPGEGATAALLARSRLMWGETDDALVDGVRVDEHGDFALSAPPGAYVLRVRDGARLYHEPIDLPHPEPVEVDVEHMGGITVVVVDGEGRPAGGRVVVLHDEHGQQQHGGTDAAGALAFAGLAPGTFRVLVPEAVVGATYTFDDMVEVPLARGEEREVTVALPASTGPRYARLVTPDGGDPSAWRARYQGMSWVAVEPSGRVPLDLASDHWVLEFAGPDRRTYMVPIPKDAPDGCELHLAQGGERYAGRLSDAGGAPLAGVRVFADPETGGDQPDVIASVVTDEAGRFELTGLADCSHLLSFHQNPERNRWYEFDSDYAGLRFRPRAAPGEAGWLELALTRSRALATERVYGSVRRADGTPLAEATVSVECVTPVAGGEFLLGQDQGLSQTDAEGRFELLRPVCARRTFRVFAAEPGQPPRLVETRQTGGAGAEVLLTVP
ncbi:MAG: sigma-70 family RNA polymerase sigma factor [Planctomycetes bacterium]|nr:sigma-70 family RNA polymerase sigma factor [Planctomycetota bacterium]